MAERPGFTRKKGLSRQNGQGRAGSIAFLP
jgi:hypothetical protein